MILPASVRRWLCDRLQTNEDYPPVGKVRFGNLRRVAPISRIFGYDRGVPIDRYYIENFLTRYSADVRGRVLEVGDNAYTQRFGAERVTKSDVLHISEGNPQATFVADLSRADHVPSDLFDCVVLTQTLQLIYDVREAIKTIHRILKPGGVLLATFPGISQIANDEWGKTWYWSFTTLSAERLFGEVFPAANVSVEAHGNVFVSIAFLHGLALSEVNTAELDHRDPSYELSIAVRAVKPDGSHDARVGDTAGSGSG
jgi:SAM-dependent methyltransferase